jgi:hypothetical protein
MRASKENAKEAAKLIQHLKDDTENNSLDWTAICFLSTFLEAAIKKLPTEASYAKDKKRERKTAKAELSHPAD